MSNPKVSEIHVNLDAKSAKRSHFLFAERTVYDSKGTFCYFKHPIYLTV